MRLLRRGKARMVKHSLVFFTHWMNAINKGDRSYRTPSPYMLCHGLAFLGEGSHPVALKVQTNLPLSILSKEYSKTTFFFKLQGKNGENNPSVKVNIPFAHGAEFLSLLQARHASVALLPTFLPERRRFHPSNFHLNG